MHAFDGRTDRQTDRQTEFSSLDRVCIACSAVKMSSVVNGYEDGNCYMGMGMGGVGIQQTSCLP